MRLRTIIVDDEPMARKGLSEDLREIDFVETIGVAENSFQALDLLTTLRPDLVLLDIDMPGLSGLDLLKSLSKPPMIIIVTAYAEYALEGYELDVMDYLIKPVDFSRLQKACCKAREFHLLRHPPDQPSSSGQPLSPDQPSPLGQLFQPAGAINPGPEYFFLRSGGKYEKLFFRELLFVEAADNYVMIHITGKKILTYQTLKYMETILPATHFMKVHKSFIVALDKVRAMDGQTLFIEGFSIPVSRNMKEAVTRRILGTH